MCVCKFVYVCVYVVCAHVPQYIYRDLSFYQWVPEIELWPLDLAAVAFIMLVTNLRYLYPLKL